MSWGDLRKQFGETNTLSQFSISKDDIARFNRIFESPNDCFISVLQMINVINSFTANMLRIPRRIACPYTLEHMELMLTYALNKNCNFRKFNSWNSFWKRVQTIDKGKTVVAGYIGHVFLISRDENGNYIYIDPQANDKKNITKATSRTPCALLLPECRNMIENKSWWMLLYQTNNDLTIDQQNAIAEYVSDFNIVSKTFSATTKHTTIKKSKSKSKTRKSSPYK